VADPAIEAALGVTFAEEPQVVHPLLDWDRARRIAAKWFDTPSEIERCVGFARAFVCGQPKGLEVPDAD